MESFVSIYTKTGNERNERVPSQVCIGQLSANAMLQQNSSSWNRRRFRNSVGPYQDIFLLHSVSMFCVFPDANASGGVTRRDPRKGPARQR